MNKKNASITSVDKNTILIVDDEPNNLRLLAVLLKEHLFEVRTVTSGSMALRSAQLDPPDIILLDINMPDMTGYEVCQELKASGATSDIPVIFISALDATIDKVRAFKVGGGDYISKPFQPEEVLVRIENQLMLRRTREDLRKLHRAVEQSASSIMITNTQGEIEYVNPKFTRVTGYTAEEVQGKNPSFLKSGTMSPETYQELWETVTAGKEWQGEFQNRKKNGEIFWEVASISPIVDQHGTITHFLAVKEDITRRKESEKSLRQANEEMSRWIHELKSYNREITLLNGLSDSLQTCQTTAEAYRVIEKTAVRLFQGNPGALYMVDDEEATPSQTLQIVSQWGNMQFLDTLSACSCQAVRGKRAYIVNGHPSRHSNSECPYSDPITNNYSYLCVPLVSAGKTFGILRLLDAPGHSQEAYEHWLGLALMMSDHLALALANLHLRERLHEQSIRDPLTGLYNRRYLNDTLSREIGRATRCQLPIGVIMADIDHFKRFNDTYGHDAGDSLLHAVGLYFQTHIRNEDIACRYGGEEFVLILPEASLPETRKRAETLRRGIYALQAFHNGQLLEAVTISLGVAAVPDHGTRSEEVLKAADIALYEAKAAGRNRVCVAKNALSPLAQQAL